MGLPAGTATPQPAPRRGAVTPEHAAGPDAASHQARPPQPWVRAKVDPVVLKLDELIKAIEELSSMPENRASVPRLDSVMRGAIEVAEELNSVHQLSMVRITSGTRSITFEPILQKMLHVAYYYAHLAFCMTPQGHAWIREVMESGKFGQGSEERLRVKSHRLVENLTHDALETFVIDRMEGLVPLQRRGRQGSHRVFRRLPAVERLSRQERQQGAARSRQRRTRRCFGARSRRPARQQGVSSQIAAPDLHIPGEGSLEAEET